MTARVLSKGFHQSKRFSLSLKIVENSWTCQRTRFHISSALGADISPTRPTISTSYIHGTSSWPLLPKTVGQCLDDMVEKRPEREALVFMRDGIRKTFAEFKQDVDQLAAGLLALGLKRGARLGMWGPNTYEWLLIQFATAQTGIILVSVNPAYQVKELEFVLQKVGCTAVVCPTQFKTQRYYDMLKQVCPELEKASPGGLKSSRLPDLSTVIILDSKQPGAFQMSEVMQAGTSKHLEQLRTVQRKLSCDDPINIQFTSGTTGSPKGAMLSHHNIVNNANLIGLRLGYHWKDLRVCLPVPMYHCFAMVGGAMVMALHGCTLVFPSPSFEGRASLEAIQTERCNLLCGTPTMFIDMLGQPDIGSIDFSSLSAGIMAGSSCPAEVMKKVMNTMNMPELSIGYGTTENSPVTFLGFPMDEIKRKTETVGYIIPHTEAKVVNPNTGEIVPLNTAGELLIRGYCVMLGYWGDPTKTAESITTDRWYKTGDIASLDEYGYCKIEGRIRDMMIRGGENIYPAEIEQFLHTHPKVHEAQVIGVKDERMGEEVCACIKLMEGVECTAEEIKAFCKGQISHFKIPRYVLFMKKFPLTVSGKVQKYKLRESVEKDLGL
ncbi:medium-chain acyl-CoA ligase ACSF2 [Huso huso]|uniref:Medium-chain acyl-CoA ligase ACSF2, mitochondrial n=1 Tax=Huso huso TaxID=61971 RepID=A0ABR0Z194_HUSHU